MAEQIGEILVRIRADMKQLEDALNKSGTQVKSFSDKMASAAKTMTNIGMKMSLAVTAPLVLIGKKAVESAMDVVESENLFEVSMGNMADEARAFSEEFARSVGLNEYSVRKNIGTFNVMFDAMGMGTAKSYELAQGLTTLAYDMASFYNLEVEDAFQKLQAGITGEIEPLKRLGIVVNETTIQQWAWNNGLVEQGKKLNEQEKILARYGAIMDATSKAQGDLARTLDSPANKMRISKEQVGLMVTELGQGLIPVVMDVIDIIKPYVEKFTNAEDSTKKFVITVGLIAAGAGPTLLFFSSMIKAANTLRDSIIGLNAAAASGGLTGTIVSLIPVLGELAGVFVLNRVQAAQNQEVLNAYPELFAKITNAGDEWAYGQLTNTEKITDAIRNLNNAQKQYGIDVTRQKDELIQRYLDEQISIEELQKKLGELYYDVYEFGRSELPEFSGAWRSAGKELGIFGDKTKDTEKAQGNLEGQMDNTTESIEEQKDAIDKLLDSLFELYDINQSVEEAGWAYEDALKKLDEAIREYGEGSREAKEATHDVQDEIKDYMGVLAEVIGSEKLSIEEKNKLISKYNELGSEAVKSGYIVKGEFEAMELVVTGNFNEMLSAGKTFQDFVDSMHGKDIVSTHTIREIYEAAEVTPAGLRGFSTQKQSGGEMPETGYIPDLNIIGIKGEGLLTREIMNAIKTGREDYLGVSGKSSQAGNNIFQNFYLSGITIREEADIHKMARELYDMSQTKIKLGG